MEREARLQGILHHSQKPQLSFSPVKEPLMESLADRCPTTRALNIMTTSVHDMIDTAWFSLGAETHYIVFGVDIRSFS